MNLTCERDAEINPASGTYGNYFYFRIFLTIVKIIYFDISRFVKENTSSDTVILGTAGYAAREEFKRLYYSEAAYRPTLKNVFVSYKVNVMKPYYTCEDVPESAYFRYVNKTKEINIYMSDLHI